MTEHGDHRLLPPKHRLSPQSVLNSLTILNKFETVTNKKWHGNQLRQPSQPVQYMQQERVNTLVVIIRQCLLMLYLGLI